MKNCLILFILLFFFAFNISAQEEFVKKIRGDYVNYNAKIEKMLAGDTENSISPFKIKTSQIRPALGPVEIEITYYFDEKLKTGPNKAIEDPKYNGTIRKVVYTESMPSFTDYREIFYDSKGELCFYFSKLMGYTCGEKRMYFNLSKMIKIKFNPFEGSDCFGSQTDDKFPDFTRSEGKLTNDDLEWEKWIIKYATYHKKTFQNLFESFQ
jgi:hypothetical protein